VITDTNNGDARIRELEARIATLERAEASSSKDLAATIDSVLRDAEKRSQLLANGNDASAGYDNGFFIRAGDAWSFKPGIQFQFRNVTNFRDNVGSDEDNTIENGFEVHRMRFDFGGNALTKDLTYFFQWESVRSSGDTKLLESWVRYMFSDPWGVWIGQMKDQVSHEFTASTKRNLAVENSMVDSLIGGGVGGYTQGVYLIYGNYGKDQPLNAFLGTHDGAGQMNTDFVDVAFDWGVNARAEYKFMGDWKNYPDQSAIGTKADLLVLGAGIDWSQNGDGDQVLAALDLQYENASGLGIYGAALMRHRDEGLTGTDDATDFGGLIEAAYMLTPSWEIFGRYDVTVYDNDILFANGNTEDTFHEFTVGLNYYLGKDGSAGHRAKITVDLTYLPNGAPKSLDGLGILDANNGDDEWILRAQFQLAI